MIPKFVNFTQEKCVNRQKLRMEDVSLIYFEQIVSFCALSSQIQSHSNCFVKTLA